MLGLTFLILLFSCAPAKFVSTSVMLSDLLHWKYITKFAMDKGTGEYSVRAKFTKAVNEFNETRVLTVPIVQDTRWEDVLNQETCDAKRRVARFEKEIELPTNGNWSVTVYGSLKQNVRPYFWFLSLADCKRSLLDSHRIRIEINITNTDGSHFSLEDQGLGYVYLFYFVAFTGLLSSSVVRLLNRFQKTDSIEPPLLILSIAVSSEISGLMFEALHLWLYSYDGTGISIFEYFFQTADLISQLVVTILFLLISSGWILRYSEFPDLDISLPISFLVILLNLMIAGLGKLTDDSYSKFTDYEGLAGGLLLTLRLGMWGWFVFSMRELYISSQGQEKHLIWTFSFVASIYFLALPVLVIISWFIAPYVRKPVVTIGGLAIQLAVFLLLSRLLSEKSTFYKMSTLAGSVLPGSKVK